MALPITRFALHEFPNDPNDFRGQDEERIRQRAIDAQIEKTKQDIASGKITLDQQEAIQPEVLRQLNQEALPPNIPRQEPIQGQLQGRNLPPNIPQDDPFAPQKNLLQEQEGLLSSQNKSPGALAFSPALQAIYKQRESNLQGRQDTAKRDFGMKLEGMIGPALADISTASNMPGGTHEQARTKSAALTKVLKDYPLVAGDPRIKEAISTATPKNTDFNPNTSVFNMDMGGVGIEFWANQLRDGKIAVDQLPALAVSQRARNKEAWSRAVVALAEKPAEGAPETPSAFTPSGSHVGMAQAKNPANQRQLGFVETALPNIDRLIALSDKVERTGIPLMNAGIMKTKYNMGDADVALLNNAKVIMTDELNQIFAGSQGGSDMSRHMAQALIDQNLDPKTFRATMQQVKSLLLTRKKAIGSTMGQYGPKVEAEKPQTSSQIVTPSGKAYTIEAE